MNVFIAFTVDQVEGLIAAALGSDNLEELRRISSDLRRASESIKAWAMAVGGSPILDLGTIGVVQVPADHMTELPGVAHKYSDMCEGTLSVGIGMTIAEAQTAMKYSSVQGGDQISLYTPEMEDHVHQAEQPAEDPLLADLGKSEALVKGGKTGSSEPTGFADGPSDGGSQSQAAGDPQNGAASPAEGNSPMPQPDAPSAGADPNGGSPADAGGSPSSGGDGGGEEGQDDPRTAVINALQQIKQQAATLEQLKQNNPQAFEAVKNVVQAMIIMAQGMAQDEEQTEKAQSVSKSEAIDKSEGRQAVRRAIAACIASGKHNKETIGGESTCANCGYNDKHVGVSVKGVESGDGQSTSPKSGHLKVVKDELDSEDPNMEKNALSSNANYAVGTQKDGKIKVAHIDPATGASQGTGWRSVRGGIVMSGDGHAASARNPGTK